MKGASLFLIFWAAGPLWAAKAVPPLEHPGHYLYVYNEGIVSPAVDKKLQKRLHDATFKAGHEIDEDRVFGHYPSGGPWGIADRAMLESSASKS